MTRINLVDPKVLVRQHLFAEYRELPRIFSLVRDFEAKGGTPQTIVGQPATYVLGPGHIKFFYTRLAFLVDRQRWLMAELRERNYAIPHTDVPGWWFRLHPQWFGLYLPTPAEIETNVRRINHRLVEMGLPDAQISV